MESVLLGVTALACPLGMGAMMWFMAKGMRPRQQHPPLEGQEEAVSVEKLRAEHRRLGAEIERLDHDQPLVRRGA